MTSFLGSSLGSFLELSVASQGQERRRLLHEQKEQRSGATEASSSRTPTEDAPPSRAATALANELLAVPMSMEEVSKTLKDITTLMEGIQQQLDSLVQKVMQQVVRPAVQQAVNEVVPSLYFLNENHETHLTKAEARREREQARKAQGKGKKSSPASRRRKPASRRPRR